MASSPDKDTSTKTINIALCGAAGRMGREIFRGVVLSSDIAIARAYEVPKHRSLGMKIGNATIESDDAPDFLEGCQVMVDFSAPADSVRAHLEKAAGSKVAVVVGSTGLDDQTRDAMQTYAKKIPILYSANMSLGINLLMALAKKTQELLGGGFDIDIIEAHHRTKRDMPSGTSLMIEQNLKLVDPDVKATHHSIRAGDIIGEHTVMFTGVGERLEFTHRATSREAFVKGVLAAVRFIAGCTPGFYDMGKVLGI